MEIISRVEGDKLPDPCLLLVLKFQWNCHCSLIIAGEDIHISFCTASWTETIKSHCSATCIVAEVASRHTSLLSLHFCCRRVEWSTIIFSLHTGEFVAQWERSLWHCGKAGWHWRFHLGLWQCTNLLAMLSNSWSVKIISREMDSSVAVLLAVKVPGVINMKFIVLS